MLTNHYYNYRLRYYEEPAMLPIINCELLKKHLSVQVENWIKGDNQLCSNFKLQFIHIWLDFHPTVDIKLLIFTTSMLHFFQMFFYIYWHTFVLLIISLWFIFKYYHTWSRITVCDIWIWIMTSEKQIAVGKL
jgi:hypothetical protein